MIVEGVQTGTFVSSSAFSFSASNPKPPASNPPAKRPFFELSAFFGFHLPSFPASQHIPPSAFNILCHPSSALCIPSSDFCPPISDICHLETDTPLAEHMKPSRLKLRSNYCNTTCGGKFRFPLQMLWGIQTRWRANPFLSFCLVKNAWQALGWMIFSPPYTLISYWIYREIYCFPPIIIIDWWAKSVTGWGSGWL